MKPSLLNYIKKEKKNILGELAFVLQLANISVQQINFTPVFQR